MIHIGVLFKMCLNRSKSPALGAENLPPVAPVSVQPKTCPESAGPQGARQEHWNSGLGNIPTSNFIQHTYRTSITTKKYTSEPAQ